ncbi:metal-dependent transcriptional regulator [uncultured Marivirga sp.]|jgi:DtxR family Mn-dependent transcriptional regulator|uniref:metal-dependent transcriptional regulator n=1 Tax=Marivirga tractuosa TaxID=1006 RepID=UPI0030EF3E38|tara:strand:- start:138418 stop:139074 length:657 start_codon:yes stop_codon:yes gene_type:complete
MKNESSTVENYIKAIYSLCDKNGKTTVSAVAERVQNNPSSVSDMIRRLHEKGLLENKSKLILSKEGNLLACQLIRKHRLWETFLVRVLNFKWDEVHDIAEQLEHVHSPLLTERLEVFLEYPKFDPHGDPIPDKKGNLPDLNAIPLTEAEVDQLYIFRSVATDKSDFLNHLNKKGLQLGQKWKVTEKEEFDGSVKLLIDENKEVYFSETVAQNLYVSAI